MTKLLSAAYKYIENGICVIATKENKQAFLAWAEYQSRQITRDEARDQFNDERATCLAIICGPSSGNLEVIDVDTKYDLTGTLYKRLTEEIEPELLSRLLIVKTKSGGYHIYYRSEVIEENQKLARRETTSKEKEENPNEKVKVLIETRGERGYVIAPPSEGYRVISGSKIPVVTINERDQLLNICRSFNEFFEEVRFKPARASQDDKYTLSPWKDYDARASVIDLLTAHGWTAVKESSERVYMRRPGKSEGISGDYHKGLNLFKSFSTSTVFEDGKGYSPSAVFAMLECKGDFNESARKLLELGYGNKLSNYGHKVEKEIYKRKKDGQTKHEIITALTKHGVNGDEATDAYDELEKAWGPEICEFWDLNDKGQIIINRRKLEQFMSNVGGFYLYFYDKNSIIYRLIKLTGMFVEEVSTEHIKKFIKTYTESLPERFDNGKTPDELLEVIYKGSTNYFSSAFLEFLDRKDLNFLKDTKEAAYLPFKNGVVEITKDDVTLKEYKDIGQVIWKSEVIDHNIIIDQDFEITECEFFKFLQKVCGDDELKWEYAMSLIGYLLHKYKDAAKPFCVVLCEETEDEEKGGGTGKGIMVKALSYILNTERIDGKNFKLDKNFAFQRVGLDTKLVAIEDVRKNVDFEGFYSIITEGITVEKKNKDELFIQYQDSPKILFTTNYTISQKGEHSKRRQRSLEFAPFFTASHTPLDYFGHKLFDDWDLHEWGRFYNLLFACVNIYLEVGVKTAEKSIKVKRKHIRLKYTEQFLDWFDDWIENGCEDMRQATKVYHDFLHMHELEKRDYSQTRFGRGVEEAVENLCPDCVLKKERIKGDDGKRAYISVKKRKDTVNVGLDVVNVGLDIAPF